MSRLSEKADSNESTKSSWLTHTTSAWKEAPGYTADPVDLDKLDVEFGPRPPDSFTIDYLARVGVSAMGFPWKVVQHYGDATKMVYRARERQLKTLCTEFLGPLPHPLNINRIVLIRGDDSSSPETLSAQSRNVDVLEISGPKELCTLDETVWTDDTVIAYIPLGATSLKEVPTISRQNTWRLIEIMKFAVNHPVVFKVFVLTTNVIGADSFSALAQAPLVGHSRVITGEHPEHFGGLFDCEDHTIPLTAVKYIQAADVVRILDGVPRTARLRSLPKNIRSEQVSRSFPRAEGTYLISGGLGPLGLATTEFLAGHGARRLVLISRRAVPPRRSWPTVDPSSDPIIDKLQQLEKQGVSFHNLSLDITGPDASTKLLTELDRLNLPPVLGVVHAAGVLENEMILDCTQDAFDRVLSPKIDGALALHHAFPPGTVDFFMMFSSCGQLFGFPGQGSYGSGNAFLDGLATYRRKLGDNARSFQWSSWRGMGMGSDSEFVAAELESKGITDITRDEAFQAWLHLAEYDIDHGVVLRSRTISADKPLPAGLLRDIISRSAPEQGSGSAPSQPTSSDSIPPPGPELNSYLD
ncbi:KR domain-containing protein [Aspergillus venezuelensis]